MTNNIIANGELINKDSLQILKAKEFVIAIEKSPYANFIECRKIASPVLAEVIVFDVEPEVGQRTTNDIRIIERIAVEFTINDTSYPEVLALRDDFPPVPHLNLRRFEKPHSLCLYEEPYEEIKLRWTAALFLEDIRRWLALTSQGVLHAIDQPLEPLLPSSSSTLVIPFDVFSESGHDNKAGFMIIKRMDSEWKIDNSLGNFRPLIIRGETQAAGIIHKTPENFYDLHLFLQNANIDLLTLVRNSLKKIYNEQKKQEEKKEFYNDNLVLIAYLPAKRSMTSAPESFNTWAFLVKRNIKTIGEEIGVWKELTTDNIGINVVLDSSKNGKTLEIEVLNHVFAFSRELACLMNGLAIDRRKLLLIGCGALGSQIFINLVRAGFGEWTVVDDDCLLPHNLARHALPAFCIGHSKAKAIAALANNIIPNDNIAKAISTNVFNPNKTEELTNAFQEAQAIIDISTSIPVARHLAIDVQSDARRISIFLNPTGTDSVILAEDKKREITLDCLEMQYYRYLINTPYLVKHLQYPKGPIRYARSCRDISTIISQDMVALHSALCSRLLRKLLLGSSARITICHSTDDNIGFTHNDFKVHDVIKIEYNNWILCFDKWLTAKIARARKAKLPNETGGILIGSFDMQRKIVYIVDTILSPPDSIEKPTTYIRGKEGLRKRLDDISLKTRGRLEYIGEWHSHPKGASTSPSTDDKNLFEWLIKIMDVIGLPPIMLIAGESSNAWQIK